MPRWYDAFVREQKSRCIRLQTGRGYAHMVEDFQGLATAVASMTKPGTVIAIQSVAFTLGVRNTKSDVLVQ